MAAAAFHGEGSGRQSLPTRDVAMAAAGRWPAILPALGVEAAYLRPRHGPCPGCGGRDRFRFDDQDGRGTWICSGGGELRAGDGLDLLVHVHGWSIPEARDAVACELGLDRTTPPPVPSQARRPAPSVSTEERAAVRTRLRAAWADGISLDSSAANVAQSYLCARGLSAILADLPADLRMTPAEPYWAPPGPDQDRPRRLGTWPALLAVLRRPDGRGVALHRTYIAPTGDGKAAITDPLTGDPLPARKVRAIGPGATRGAAVRLYPPAATIVVAEGIETALAARLAMPEYPAWAAVSAGGIARLRLPAGVREVIVAADHDPNGAGEEAAATLAKRLRSEGVAVRAAIPPSPGTDWADVIAGVLHV